MSSVFWGIKAWDHIIKERPVQNNHKLLIKSTHHATQPMAIQHEKPCLWGYSASFGERW